MSTRVLAVDSPAADAVAADSSAALLTLGISLYSIAILVCLGVAINAARFRRRRLAITMAWVVGVLTVAGVIIAILSSVHGG
ncbi:MULTISPECIES: hypothetical protein [Gordonia]|jgi:hypothetical protein|uniref:Uncharacterized protein n=2 Tax=Gordonia alkanivorans TaxID=84096 RepID=F9VSD2_9ACTN|nr:MULTISPECIES: hypothetical protein [Gordonia]AZZ83030.1 hypothetical protein C5O27_19800 [Gordonia alkanivorans]ETA08646.1 membrane protein [Gordonia alkanivorans CGMCC 6845]MDH3005306.1 hypothetical protein [Gordonia alkanivorans]MDH3010395.1 hypothetical protein [Gordonia alkanivorans]MDH3014718.1 hypothetical protein [Gordonia alkanivorans]